MQRTWKTKAAILSAVATVGLFQPSFAKATTYNWNVTSGDFDTATNWNPNGTPGSGDLADITNGGTATISSTDPTLTVANLDVGDSSGSLTGNLLQTGGALNLSSGGLIAIGHAHSTGIYNFSAGVINAPALRIYGNTTTDPTGVATQMYVGTGATLNSGGEFDVGYDGGAGPGAGTLNISGGTITNSGNLEIGEGPGAVGTVVMNSGNLTETGQLWIADAENANNQTGGTGTFILNGGTVTTSNWAVIGRGGSTTGVLTINTGGTFIHLPSGGNAFEVGSYGGNNGTANTSTLNLNGGTLITDYIEDESPASTVAHPGSQTINFNGGVLQTNDNDGGFLGGHDPVSGVAPILNVGNNGAIFNTSTYTIGVTLPLLHSGSNPTDGGLTKYGSGTLNLSGGSTYNGTTTINAGTLNVLSSATSASNFVVNAGTLNLLGSTTGGISVNAGGTVGSYNASGAGGSATGSLTFTGSTTLLVNPTGTQFLTVGGAANASGANVTVVPTITTASTSPEEILWAKGGIIGTLGSPGSGANFVPGIRGTLTEAPDPSTVGTDLFITAATAGPANLVWTGTDPTHPSYWDVQTTINWYNTGSSSSDEFYAGDNVTFDDTGTTLNVAIQGVSVSPTSVTFNNSTAKSYTFTGGAIAGSGSLSVIGGGTVTLKQSNSYTGATNISNGTLVMGTGGSLSLSTAVSLGSGASNGVLRLGDATGPVSTSVGGLSVVGTGTGNELIGGNANTSTLTVASSVFVGTPSNPTAVLTVGAGANLYGNSGSNPSIGIGPANGMTGTVTVLTGGTLTANSNDLWVGNGSGGVGTLDISGGTVLANGWIAPGRAGGTGTINMTGGSIIKTGGGDLDIAGDGAGSHGYFYQTGGTVTTSTFVVIGENNTTEVGVWNLSGGSTSANIPELIVGSSGNGTMNIFGGGTLTSTGVTLVGQNNGAVGTLNITGATETTNGLTASYAATVTVGSGGLLNIPNGGPNTAIASGSGTNATLNVLTGGTFNAGTGQVFIGDSSGVGVFNVSGSVTVDTYLAVGRVGGTGTLNLMSGGSISQLAGAGTPTIFGSDGAGGNGYFIQTGGTYSGPGTQVILGESTSSGATPAAQGTWNMSGGSATTFSTIVGLQGTGTLNVSSSAQLNSNSVMIGNGSSVNSSAVGTVNLNGGTLTTAGVAVGDGTGTLNISGGVLQARSSSSAFLMSGSSSSVNLQSALSTIDTQSYNVGVQTTLNGPGGLNKIGTGKLSLVASNSFSGNTQVSAGTLAIANANALSNGSVTLANSTTLALTAASPKTNFSQFYLNAQTTPMFQPVVSSNQTAVTLTTAQNNDAVSIFNSAPVTISDSTGFNASFIYDHASQGPEQSGADGVVFVLQNANNTPNAVGGAGGSLAYNNATGFSSSLAAGVDLFLDRLLTGFGNGSAGAFTNVQTENTDPLISQTTALRVSIVYNGTAQTLTETLTDAVTGALVAQQSTGSIDAATLLGGSGGMATAYPGFTAATGGANDLQSISDFTFNSTGQTAPAVTGAVGITNSVFVAALASSTIQLAPTLNFSSGAVGPINIGSGATLALSVGASPAFNVTHGVLTTTSVTFANASSGKLDLANNALDITGQSLGTVDAMVASGFNGGTWTGQGITSTTAATDTHHLTAVGVILNSVDGTTSGAALYGSSAPKGLFDGISPAANTDVLVKYTYYGDANLDGQVDGSDYSRIDSTYLSEAFVNGVPTTPISGWYNGDFNYDNVVNGSDYTLMDNAFNSQGLNIDAPGNPQVQIAAQIAGSSAVPEPTSLGLLAIGAAGLLGRRRRRNSIWLAGAN